MYNVTATKKFEKSLKKCIKRGLDARKINTVLKELSEKGFLPPAYRPHKLSGKYQGNWECHIQPDWLLVWEQRDEELILLLIDTGTPSDIFG